MDASHREPNPASDAPDLSVVIPAFNAAATIGEQLAALGAQHFPGSWEIVVVDNGSSDDTRARVDAFAHGAPVPVRCVITTDGSGPSHARNIGIAAARANRVACCDADDVVGAGWVDAMDRALRTHRFVAGGLELDRLNPPWLVAGRGRSIEMCAISHGNTVFPHGCNFGVDRELFLTHRFDEAWRAGEEIELAYRLKAAGVDCVFVPDAVVHYRYRTGLRATFRQARIAGQAQQKLPSPGPTSGPGLARSTVLRRVAWLVARSPRLLTKSGRVRWTWVAGDVVGRVFGHR